MLRGFFERADELGVCRCAAERFLTSAGVDGTAKDAVSKELVGLAVVRVFSRWNGRDCDAEQMLDEVGGSSPKVEVGSTCVMAWL